MIKKIERIYIIVLATILIVFSNIRVNISESSPIGIYLVNRFSKKYKKGDYIVYRIDNEYKEYVNKELKDLDTVKQIKGIAGDEIEYIDNKIYINKEEVGEIIYEIPIKSRKKYIIPENEFLTIGDVSYSVDGRYYGTIKKKDIKYKVHLIYRIRI
ncbi:signal peptidase I [Streptobacillus moniliformis]|uniref:signal peptidase I n=1 Tax=Streptobacillus moniliformis TaxID=34105 RepID=UPI0007E44A82|nr:signal peptidase I [Streptobacillus moniliformis]